MDITKYRKELKRNGVLLSIEGDKLRIRSYRKLNETTKAKLGYFRDLIIEDIKAEEEDEAYSQAMGEYAKELGGQVSEVPLEPNDIYGCIPWIKIGEAKAYFTATSIYLHTPYSEDFLEALKAAIPPPYRRWLPEAKAWHVKPGRLGSGRAFTEEILLLMAEYYDPKWYAREYLT